jgi:hypothetical protein
LFGVLSGSRPVAPIRKARLNLYHQRHEFTILGSNKRLRSIENVCPPILTCDNSRRCDKHEKQGEALSHLAND